MTITECMDEFTKGNGKNLGRTPTARYASFDYCFNYFQYFRERRELAKMAEPSHMQISCLHLAFYLASWGMFRGSSFLLERSFKFLEPTIRAISSMDKRIWSIDVDTYNDDNIDLLLNSGDIIANSLDSANSPSDTLTTKIMLGVFANVPAFDDNFRKGFGCYSFGKKISKRSENSTTITTKT